MSEVTTVRAPDPAVPVGARVGTLVGEEVERWLSEQTDPQHPPMWLPRWSRSKATAISSVEHLAVLISQLDTDAYGGVEHTHDGVRRWSQTMRGTDGWIVEVHDGTDTDFAQRVVRASDGIPMTSVDGDAIDDVWTSMAAAGLMMSWLRGSLPEYSTRTLDYLSARQRRLYGFDS